MTYTCKHLKVKSSFFGLGRRSCVKFVDSNSICEYQQPYERPNVIASDNEHVTPVLWGHDQAKPLGEVRVVKGRLRVALLTPLSQEEVFSTFGNVGVMVIKYVMIGGKMLFEEFEIIEFSLMPRVADRPLEGENK